MTFTQVDETGSAINVQLSAEETYADTTPVRSDHNKVSAFVSIMRGCNNMCTYCIVPFTRARERSRPVDYILREVEMLRYSGYREVTTALPRFCSPSPQYFLTPTSLTHDRSRCSDRT